MKRLRIAFLVPLLGGAGAFFYKKRLGSAEPQPSPTPQWPPMRNVHTVEESPTAPRPFAAAASGAAAASAAAHEPSSDATTNSATIRRWAAPVDGQCPDGFPVKANDNSGIFHIPGGRFYARTVPERCYASADDAIADGYRPAKA
jgi:hypothetical protein